MKVILLQDVYKHGVAGEIVDVADGFARNYLIPSKRAAKATDAELKRMDRLMAAAAERRKSYEALLNELGRKIDRANLTFFRRAASTGKLFGSVTTQEMAEELNTITGVDINRRRIAIQQVRDVGMHEIPVRLGTEVSPVLFVRVIPEDQRVEYERQREAHKEGLINSIEFDEKGNIVVRDLNKLRANRVKAEEEAALAAERAAAEQATKLAEAAAAPEAEVTAEA
ncbi:MAG: 50S ribosomal protein L9 [Phototrophicaceae bacterium]